MVIRIRNLEKIQYLQPNSAKVLMGGSEAINLAKRVLKDQLVWVENIQAEEGAYVADVFPSFEQVITAYKEKRIANGDNVSKSTKTKLRMIYAQMLTDFNLAPLIPTSTQSQAQTKEIQQTLYTIYVRTLSNIRSSVPVAQKSSKTKTETSGGGYANTFQRAMLTIDAISWFNEKGQKMHPVTQKLFVDLLQSFQSEADSEARYTQIKLKEIMKRNVFLKEIFLNVSEFDRGKFIYECLDWFKNKGQYLPDDVQVTFVNWLRIYQQSHSNDGDYIKSRLQWMLKNNDLYLDFIDLSE
jgi:hypothetical protein